MSARPFSYHDNYMVHSRSKVREEAMRFLLHVTNTDNMIKINESGRAPMPRKSANEKAPWMKDPRWQVALEASGVYGENEGKSRFSIPIRDNIIEPAMTKVYLGQMTAQRAMSEAAKEAREYIKGELAKWDREIEPRR